MELETLADLGLWTASAVAALPWSFDLVSWAWGWAEGWIDLSDLEPEGLVED